MKKTKMHSARIILICVLSLILVGLVGFVIYMEMGLAEKSDDVQDPATTAATENNSSEETEPATNAEPEDLPTEETKETTPNPSAQEDQSDYPIDTPWGTLHYPGKYREYLQVQTVQTPVYTVSLLASIEEEEYPLFDLCFGGNQGDVIGIAADKTDNQVWVRAVMHELVIPQDMSDGDVQILYGMQESISYVADQLERPDQALPPEALVQDITIETPFCELKIPGVWEEQLHVEVNEDDGYAVCFAAAIGSHEALPLFDIVLDGTADSYLGYLVLDGETEIAVGVNVYTFALDSSWSDEEADMVFGMMEILNGLSQNLQSLDGFILA